jgi:hypothetical protein
MYIKLSGNPHNIYNPEIYGRSNLHTGTTIIRISSPSINWRIPRCCTSKLTIIHLFSLKYSWRRFHCCFTPCTRVGSYETLTIIIYWLYYWISILKYYSFCIFIIFVLLNIDITWLYIWCLRWPVMSKEISMAEIVFLLPFYFGVMMTAWVVETCCQFLTFNK